MIESPVFVAGHAGMVGSAILRRLQVEPNTTIVVRTRKELDLGNADGVNAFFESERPATVIFAAAKVGGINANKTYPVEFMTENLKIQLATMEASFRFGVKRFLFLGSTCIYPRLAKQPMSEDQMLTGSLESTNEAYALAKISGVKLCAFYRSQYGRMFHSVLPTNLYGPGDNYHPENSHLLPAMIRRFHLAKQDNLSRVTIWGSGTPKRELLHVEDMADAIVHLCKMEDPPDWVNVGTGIDNNILEIAHMVAEAIGYSGSILTDPTKLDGTPRKLTDTTILNRTGWTAKIPLRDGIRRTVANYLEELAAGKLRMF